MYFLALAADYDGTIADHGVVARETLEALHRFKRTGRRLILVTGRRLPSIQRAFPEYSLFDRIVAENGAVLFDPSKEEERAIAPPPPPQLVAALQRRAVTPLHVGRSIVATWEPQDKVVLEEIKALGLELQIIFNKGAVMVLPPGVNKASGLAEALLDLGISSRNVVGVGDAENDHAFLRACGCSAAVANALPAVKDAADIVLRGDHGIGISELIDLMTDEASPLLPPRRHYLLLGVDRDGAEVRVSPCHGSVLIAGKSGIGKSTLAAALTERMVESGFGFCIFDPEGDYAELANSVCVGDAKTPPVIDEALDLVRKAAANVVINTQALSLADRPVCFNKLMPRLLSLRAASGRPHWILVDEAHHQMDASRNDFDDLLPKHVWSIVFITVHPEAMSANALRSVETVIALGDTAPETIAAFCRAIGVDVPLDMPVVEADEILFWEPRSGRPVAVKAIMPKQTRERHKAKYAQGELDPDASFYFRGRHGKLQLRAQNLMLFVQIAQGVDEDTWQYHRERQEYSTWFRDVIKDRELADETSAIERDGTLDAQTSLQRVAEAVKRRYTGSSKAPHNWHERKDKGRKDVVG